MTDRGRARAARLLWAVVAVGCARTPPIATPAGDQPAYLDPRRPAAARAADLVRRLTPAEKIAQLMNEAPAIPRLGVPAYDWWNEALHGVARAGEATVFPQAIALAATFDEPLVRQVATVISDEARAKFNLAQARGARGEDEGLTFFAPNLNIFRDPRWGRGQETYGEDPLLTARLGVAFIAGMQGDDPRLLKTVATAKHFAVHSGPEAVRHVFDARPSAHDLADTYLPQFEAAVREGHVASVMAAYNRLNGQACAASPWLLGQVLRQTWGFAGYVVGDCGAVDDIFATHHLTPTRAAAAAAALRAGTDLDCGHAYAMLGAALAQGLVAEADVDRAVTRLFTARVRLGLFDPPAQVPWSRLGAETVDAPAHRQLARAAAARAMVLLENRDGALPLGPSIKRIAVVGPTADDADALLGNYHGTPSRAVTFLDGIRAAARTRGIAISYARGAELAGAGVSTAQRREALAAVRRSDVVVAIVGLDPRLENEENESRFNRAGDRRELGLPRAQEKLVDALLATGKPVIVVLTGGSAVSVPAAAERAAALLVAWYPGEEGGDALADVLFGDVDPAGRLPITFYRSAADLPPFDDYAMRGRTYRYFAGAPLYPFGAGRSYTTFRYANLAVAADDKTVSVELQNTGGRPGDEVVQVYVHPRGAPPEAPRLWLAAFARVALQPGERRTVSLPLPSAALTLVDEGGTRRPIAGPVDIAVGGGQPDRDGHYPDDARGLTASVRLGN
ncbi:MAG TPA: glycoside hydrolase family 3 C-terminal domain-containing protein [Polyangia bacterium]|nr:glycoside hydrolase family 3 C-terminal domain-containing protein [Polyangia bacterium]